MAQQPALCRMKRTRLIQPSLCKFDIESCLEGPEACPGIGRETGQLIRGCCVVFGTPFVAAGFRVEVKGGAARKQVRKKGLEG